MKNLLFIGGAGFIGSNIIKSLDDSIYKIHVLEPIFANVSRLDGRNVIIHRGQLQDYDYILTVLQKEKIDTIVHLVSTLIPGSSYEDFVNEINNVVFPSIRLMQYSGKQGIKFIYFSSGGTIYGERKNKVPFKETDTPAPISYYGWSKQMMENSILFEHRTNRLDYLILRPSNPFGPGQALHGKQGLIAICIGKILSNEPITIWGNGEMTRDYIYIDDLSAAFEMLLAKNINNEIINIGSGKGYSINDIILLLEDITQRKIEVIREKERNMDVSNMILDVSKLHSMVNLENISIKEGIRKFFNIFNNL